MPVASLPSKYGIGCFSRQAYAFVDFLKEAGQSYWQILPLGETGYGDSPYQSFSTFAGNPYFIDIEELIEEGFISEQDADAADFGDDPGRVDYGRLYQQRYPLLRKAYENSPYASVTGGDTQDEDAAAKRRQFGQFCEKNADWLPDYALFSALKRRMDGRSFIEWDEDVRLRKPEAIRYWQEELKDDIRFIEFLQFLFSKQWTALKGYANSQGIKIIGDIPIYVAFDSADTWSHPELFDLDEKGYPVAVAGCPPDAFSSTGQLWGNPLYRWDYHRQTGYAWWLKRLSFCFELYDVVRIDHFRGFDAFYAIPYGDTTAEFGKWRQGPGSDFFDTVKEKLGERQIIAEDLGYLTQSVIDMVKRTGYPGMKVLQFAFDSREESDYLPHNYIRNCVVYTGTHDNETTRGWYADLKGADREYATKYVNVGSEESAAWDFIRTAFMTVGDTVIIPMQDYLNLDNSARINHPSTLGGNWQWRMLPGAADTKLAARMADLADIYRRR